MQQLFGHSVTYRIAVGPHQGRKVFTLQTLPPLSENGKSGQVAEVVGFSRHAGVTAEPHRREEWHRAMTWMLRLKRVYNIDIETCERCGGKVKVIASIEDPAAIAHILKHVKQKEALQASVQPHELPHERAPPVMRLFD